MRAALDLERNGGSILNSAFATVLCGDHVTVRRLVDAAAKLAGAATEDAQRGFKLIDAMIRWRQSDKNAVDAVPRALGKVAKIEDSRTAYEQFFDGWKKADAELPLLVDANAEYARLPR